MPSRFIDELPRGSVEVTEAPAAYTYAGYGSRFDTVAPFGSSYTTPGWQRAQANRAAACGSDTYGSGFGTSTRGARGRSVAQRGPTLIAGELVARSTGAALGFSAGARVVHQKFGPGTVAEVDGNKLTVDFDRAGRKMVLDSFVEATG